jgi:hypothetical protein
VSSSTRDFFPTAKTGDLMQNGAPEKALQDPETVAKNEGNPNTGERE